MGRKYSIPPPTSPPAPRTRSPTGDPPTKAQPGRSRAKLWVASVLALVCIASLHPMLWDSDAGDSLLASLLALGGPAPVPLLPLHEAQAQNRDDVSSTGTASALTEDFNRKLEESPVWVPGEEGSEGQAEGRWAPGQVGPAGSGAGVRIIRGGRFGAEDDAEDTEGGTGTGTGTRNSDTNGAPRGGGGSAGVGQEEKPSRGRWLMQQLTVALHLGHLTGRKGSAGQGGQESDTVVLHSTVDAQHMTPYVTPWSISVATQKLCRSVYPKHFGRSVTAPINYIGDLVRKHQRVLLVTPRHGLGNSLRGYVSSFVYAALSGRQLVRFHGSQHGQVFDTLCASFVCGFDSVQDTPDAQHPKVQVGKGGGVKKGIKWLSAAMGLAKQLEVLRPVDLNLKWKTSSEVRLSLKASQGLMLSKSPRFFDGFWMNFLTMRDCVYQAFGCSSTWCVHSRALHALIGPPTALLADVISQVLMRHESRSRKDELAQGIPKQLFDIALHFRTRPRSLEETDKDHKGDYEEDKGTDAALMKVGCGKETPDEKSQYLRACLWDCIGGIMKNLKLDLKAEHNERPLEILLATDNEVLRSAFVEKLSAHGNVYYSSGAIVHSSKSSGEEMEKLPTMAEFYLMSRSHVILEIGSYISTFAYFSGLLGNGTLAGLTWAKDGSCGLNVLHHGEKVQAGQI